MTTIIGPPPEEKVIIATGNNGRALINGLESIKTQIELMQENIAAEGFTDTGALREFRFRIKVFEQLVQPLL